MASHSAANLYLKELVGSDWEPGPDYMDNLDDIITGHLVSDEVIAEARRLRDAEWMFGIHVVNNFEKYTGEYGEAVAEWILGIYSDDEPFQGGGNTAKVALNSASNLHPTVVEQPQSVSSQQSEVNKQAREYNPEVLESDITHVDAAFAEQDQVESVSATRTADDNNQRTDAAALPSWSAEPAQPQDGNISSNHTSSGQPHDPFVAKSPEMAAQVKLQPDTSPEDSVLEQLSSYALQTVLQQQLQQSLDQKDPWKHPQDYGTTLNMHHPQYHMQQQQYVPQQYGIPQQQQHMQGQQHYMQSSQQYLALQQQQAQIFSRKTGLPHTFVPMSYMQQQQQPSLGAQRQAAISIADEQVPFQPFVTDQTPLLYNSYAQALQQQVKVSWTLSKNDTTLPQNDTDRQRLVQEVIQAISRTDLAIDSRDKIFHSHWEDENGTPSTHYSPLDKEFLAWRIVLLTEALHTQGPNVLINFDTKFWDSTALTKSWTFAHRMDLIKTVLTKSKARVGKLMAGVGLQDVVANPQAVLQMVMVNRKQNNKRTKVLEAAREAGVTYSRQEGKGKAPRKKVNVSRRPPY